MASVEVWVYAIGSVVLVSLISFIGLFLFYWKSRKVRSVLIYFIAFSVGALLGDAFIHLLPEIIGKVGFTFLISIYIILGIVVSFIVEKIIHWRHHHVSQRGNITMKEHEHHRKHHHKHSHHSMQESFAWMNLFGDGVHNFIDGLIIGASYLVSIPVGIATTVAVAFHEIPQELGDIGVLIHGGFPKGKAFFYNFIFALTSIVGAVIAIYLSVYSDAMLVFVIPFAAGSFIYIAAADLIPELQKEIKL